MYFGSADASIREILNEVSSKSGAGPMPVVSSRPKEIVEVKEEEIDLEMVGEPILTIGVPIELSEGENRVAMTPSTVRKFRQLRFAVNIETGAGVGAGYKDAAYIRNGAAVVSREVVWAKSDIILKVKKIDAYSEFDETTALGNLQLVVSYCYPA